MELVGAVAVAVAKVAAVEVVAAVVALEQPVGSATVEPHVDAVA